MIAGSAGRVTAALAIAGAVVALVANAISPRINGNDVAVYHQIANSDRYAVSGMVVLAALALVTAAFVGLSRSDGAAPSQLGDYTRLTAVVGGAIALTQSALQVYGYRQEARAFDVANAHNVVSAFWATNALDHASSALFAMATAVLLGITPILLGAAQLRSRIAGRLGVVAVTGGTVCVLVGIGELLKDDQSTFDIPFAIGSVVVTIWLLATGVVMWRRSEASLTVPVAG